MKTNRIAMVDLIKWIASLFVILIHCTFYGGFGVSVKAIARFAVPFFFLSTGYFLYGSSPDRLLKKLRRILGLAISAFLLYFIFFAVATAVQKGVTGLWDFLADFTDLEKLGRFLAFNVPFSFTNLWYLFAVVYVYLLYYALTKCKASDKLIFSLGAVLLLVHLLLWQMCLSLQLTTNTFYVRNFLFFGFPMVMAGAFLKKHQQKLPRMSGVLLVLLALTSALLSIASRWMLGNKSLPVGAILLAVSLFVYAIQCRPGKAQRLLPKAGVYSTYIYILHPCVIRLVQIVAQRCGLPQKSPIWINTMPIIVVTVTVLLAVAVCAVKEKVCSIADRRKTLQTK